MKHATPFDDTAPDADAERVDTFDVSSAETDERVTGKFAKYLDLLDVEMAERWAEMSAA